ncbi:MAG: hypothetical protein HC883_04340 [Bdellovibrionaceae bacterium]|nr:hypothetical protein [Pseudobdellovibrionaceae bacterium]
MGYLNYENLTNEFPYVVIRLISTVYERRRVVFSPRIDSADKRSFHIQWFEN